MSSCVKCGAPQGGFEVGLREPWCHSCRQKCREEYRPIREEWVFKNTEVLLEEMGVPSAYRSCRFENFEVIGKDQRRILDAVQRWPKGEDMGLFLCGPCGTGKTHLAVAALLAMRARGCRGRFTSVQEFLVQCRDSFRHDEGLEEILESVCGPKSLLLDDLGTENPTPFARETLALIIDRAYRDERVIIVTSNYDLESLAERLDARSVDRLIELCLAVKTTGQSYRQKRATRRASVRNLATTDVLQ